MLSLSVCTGALAATAGAGCQLLRSGHPGAWEKELAAMASVVPWQPCTGAMTVLSSILAIHW